MSKGAMNFVKGMGAGMAAGVVVATVGKTMMKNRKSVVKSTGKAVKAVGDIMDNIHLMLK